MSFRTATANAKCTDAEYSIIWRLLESHPMAAGLSQEIIETATDNPVHEAQLFVLGKTEQVLIDALTKATIWAADRDDRSGDLDLADDDESDLEEVA